MAVLERPAPPYSSGMVRPKTPSAPISSTIASGMSSSFRCQPWAKGTTRSSAKRRNWSRIISSSASRPVAPKLAAPWVSSMSSTRRARAASVLPWAIRVWTAGVRKAARSEGSGRAISACDMGMPPASWARYSPAPICRIRRSVSPRRPAACEAGGPCGELAEGFGVGGDPGEAVGGELVRLERGGGEAAAVDDAGGETGARGGDERAGGLGGGGGEGGQVGQERGLGARGRRRLRASAGLSSQLCGAESVLRLR